MAVEEHLQLIKQGVEAWNSWRCDNDISIILDGADFRNAALPNVNLSGAFLRGADLRGADLSGATLSSSHLISAHLSGADLSRANLNAAHLDDTYFNDSHLVGASLFRARLIRAYLRGAVLSGALLCDAVLNDAHLNDADLNDADLRGAVLHGADMRGVDLRRACLDGAHLDGASFSRAHLSGASFTHAKANGTIFDDVDLSEVKGLQNVRHHGPSAVSISTIYRSQGKIPEEFLRGCGVPESFIIQIPSLVAAMQPIQFYSCFISYSSKDEELAQRFHADLQSKGVRCWFAPEDLKIGERFRRRIDEVIRVYDRLLLILSENSVSSSWVEKEVETAMEKENEQKKTMLFPVRLDNSVMEIKTGWPADVRRTRHIGDFRRWKEHDEYQKAFARLLADLKASA